MTSSPTPLQPTHQGLVLAVRPHAESNAIIQVLSPQLGRVRGLVKQARRHAAALQPFNTLGFTHWRRLSSQLGTFSVELHISRSGLLLTSPAKLRLAAYLAPLLGRVLPEEHPYPTLPGAVAQLLAAPLTALSLAEFERHLLEQIGYGLRLNDPVSCSQGSPLAFVSPNTGRSVPLAVAQGYEARLLPLPTCWGGLPQPQLAIEKGLQTEGAQALQLTGHFLQLAQHGQPLAGRAEVVALLTAPSVPITRAA